MKHVHGRHHTQRPPNHHNVLIFFTFKHAYVFNDNTPGSVTFKGSVALRNLQSSQLKSGNRLPTVMPSVISRRFHQTKSISRLYKDVNRNYSKGTLYITLASPPVLIRMNERYQNPSNASQSVCPCVLPC